MGLMEEERQSMYADYRRFRDEIVDSANHLRFATPANSNSEQRTSQKW
jgi:hypothetical protein